MMYFVLCYKEDLHLSSAGPMNYVNALEMAEKYVEQAPDGRKSYVAKAIDEFSSHRVVRTKL